MTDNIVADLVRATMEGDLFTEEEAKTLIGSVIADSPEALPEMIERVVLWSRELRMKHNAILGTILMAHGAVQVTMEDGESEPSLRLRPDMKVEIIDDELGLKRVEFET